MPEEKFLIITADDYGASKNINEAIKIAADKNAITSISVLSNFSEALPELKKISRDHPEIGIGVHLNIVTGKPVTETSQIPSLVGPQGFFYPIDAILPKIRSILLEDVRKELRAQILELAKNDIKLDHLSDQDGILSLYSPFYNIAMELAKEFNVPVRSPFIAGIKYPDIFPNSQMYKYGRKLVSSFVCRNPFKALGLLKYARKNEMEKKIQKLDELQIRHPDLLIEYLWGNPSVTNLNYILENLPTGVSELSLHLGTSSRQENYPSGLDLNYFSNREKELKLITDDSIKTFISQFNVKMIGYSNLSRTNISPPK
jgi:predicted glycoside hydrolase/deacetylase ChbG (UPF0249 family)